MAISNVYLTVEEFTNAPTGINVNSLIPGGTVQQNQMELYNLIRQASSRVDSHCQQILGATVDTETVTAFLNREGFLRLQPNNVPIIQVNSLSYRLYPQATWNLIDPTTYQVFNTRIESFNFFSYFGLFWPNLPMPYMPQPMGSPYQPYTTPTQASYIQNIPLMVQYQYVNGYPNTTLSVAATAGQQSITVADPTGIIEGTVLTVYDSAAQEDIICSAPPVGNVVSLQSPLLNSHAIGVGVSALPYAVKYAVQLITAHEIYKRGSSTVRISSTGTATAGGKTNNPVDLQEAWEMLRPYRRVVVTQQ